MVSRVGNVRLGRYAVVARKRGLGRTEHRDSQKCESSAHDWPSVCSSHVEGLGKGGLVPPR